MRNAMLAAWRSPGNYLRVNNKTGNPCNFGAGALNISEGQDPRGIAAGIRHTS